MHAYVSPHAAEARDGTLGLVVPWLVRQAPGVPASKAAKITYLYAYVSAVVLYVVDGVFLLARTWWGRQGTWSSVCPAGGIAFLALFFPVELKASA